MLLILLLLTACYGHAPTAFDACIESVDIACNCGKPINGDDPESACKLTDEERAQYCHNFKSGPRSSDAWRDWNNCGNVALADCDASDWDCGPQPD